MTPYFKPLLNLQKSIYCVRRYRQSGLHILIVFFVFLFFSSCAPTAVKMYQLSPLKTEEVITVQDMFDQAEPTEQTKTLKNAKDIIIIGSDKTLFALSLFTLNDIFWLEIYIFNGESTPVVLNPSDLILLDGNRFSFRRLEPHDAANFYLDKVKDPPPYLYQPKYIYNVNAATSGYIHPSGNFNAQTNATVTQQEDPYHALGYNLGYSIGAAIRGSRNKKYKEMAARIYSVGLVENSQIPGKTNGYCGVFWSKAENWISPVILRFANTDYEACFMLDDSKVKRHKKK